MGGRGFEAISSSANLGRTWKMLTRAALKTCSDGGIATARLVFSVSRVMKNMKRPVLICISAKFALPAGMLVCLLRLCCQHCKEVLIARDRDFTYAMLCLWVFKILDMRSKRSVNGLGSSVLRVTCATVRQVVLSYSINSLASMTSANCSSSASIVPAFGMR
jgi:hypothetical protein